MSTVSAAPARSAGYRRGASSSSISAENLPPRTLARAGREVRDLIKNPPEGIKLVVDNDTGMPSNLGEIVAELEGPEGTPYAKKFFQLKLVLGADFPQAPPRGFFLTKIYHPNVDMSTGAICVNTLKKDWNSETTFSHVLSVIRCLLIVPFPESSLNDEAGKLFMESYDEYSKRAHLMADVHGRPVSCDGGNEKRQKTQTQSQEDDGTSKRGSPLGSKNDNSKPSATKAGGAKKAAGKMTKKKSLKRL